MECLLPFGPEAFVFPPDIQERKHGDTQNLTLTVVFMGVKLGLSH